MFFSVIKLHILIKRIIELKKDETSDYVYVSKKYAGLHLTVLNHGSPINDDGLDDNMIDTISQSETSLKRKRTIKSSDVKPNRQYFHSKNLVPMLPHEWNIDSDDESDTMWMHTISDEVCYNTYSGLL